MSTTVTLFAVLSILNELSAFSTPTPKASVPKKKPLLENWSPPANSHEFQNIEELNTNNIVRTIEELQEKSYGYNVRTFCQLDVGLFFNDAYRKGGEVFFRWDDYSVDKDDKKRDENLSILECAVERRYEDADEEGEYLYV